RAQEAANNRGQTSSARTRVRHLPSPRRLVVKKGKRLERLVNVETAAFLHPRRSRVNEDRRDEKISSAARVDFSLRQRRNNRATINREASKRGSAARGGQAGRSTRRRERSRTLGVQTHDAGSRRPGEF